MPDETFGPREIRDTLADLLAAIERDAGLARELERAKREFFAGNPTAPTDPDRAEMAALRFAEWYLCERESEILGEVPMRVARTRFGLRGAVPADSIVGVFLVQRGGDQPSVRDLDRSGGTFELTAVPESLSVGDVLIGRLYESGDDVHYVPSAAASIVSGSPRFGLAYRQDLDNLGLERRLTQAELEHLLFRDDAAVAQRAADDERPAPLEHVEAALARFLAEAGKTDVSATEISEALRTSARPTTVVESLLEELAFETEVDLEEARRTLLDLSSAILRGDAPPTSAEDDPSPPAPTEPVASTRDDRTHRRRAPTTRRPDDDREATDENSLGARLARRIEEGLSGEESVEELFEDVERMLGEPIVDEDDDAAVDDGGDLEPLVREYLWEQKPDEDDRDRLDAFVAMQRVAPVPKTSVELLDPDEFLRFFLLAWLDRPTRSGALEVIARHAVLEKFLAWTREIHDLDRSTALDVARSELVSQVERLAAASAALVAEPGDASRAREVMSLSGSDREPELYAIVEVSADVATVRVVDAGSERAAEGRRYEIRRTGAATEWASLRAEDLVLGRVATSGDRFDGIAIVVPGRLERLLG